MTPDVEVRIRAPLNPTEVPERVEEAVRNLFPDADLERETTQVRAATTSLAHLADLIERHQIPDSARVAMLRGREKGTGLTRFELGKQAAYVGKPNFSPPPAGLGNLQIELEAADEDHLVRAIYETAPDTTVSPELSRLPPSQRPAEEEQAQE